MFGNLAPEGSVSKISGKELAYVLWCGKGV